MHPRAFARLLAWLPLAGCTSAASPVDAGQTADASSHDASSEGDVASPPPDAACLDAGCAFASLTLPQPSENVYEDKGAANGTASFRALIALPIQNQAALEKVIAGLYSAGDATFRQYLTKADWATTYAPPPRTAALVGAFLAANNLKLSRQSTNGLLIEATGTVAAFNAAFHTTLHTYTRTNPLAGSAPLTVYGATGTPAAPADFVQAISAVISCDLPPAPSTLAPEPGTPGTSPPAGLGVALTPAQVAGVYGALDLGTAGATGQGVSIGIVAGGAVGLRDVETFWESFGVLRSDPVAIETLEAPAARVAEATVDTEWAGVLAPNAALTLYEGPDSYDTSLVYAFHEAIGRGDVGIVTDSFSSRESSVAPALAAAYDAAAMQAAALGITVVAPSGDGAAPDVPSASPYVTAVGGTSLLLDDGGTGYTETAWSLSGSGLTSFPRPSWQPSFQGSTSRITADLSVNGGTSYWSYYLGTWSNAYGTTFSAPIVAGLLADVTSARTGKPPLGYLNPILYSSPEVQASFRDITTGGTSSFPAGVGWDPPTGWGAVQARELAAALP